MLTPPPESHPHPTEPSPWVVRFAPLLPAGARALDLACGGGRHARYLMARGARLTCIDRDVSAVAQLANDAEVLQADLEDGRPWPLQGRTFDAVVVVNYLVRPLLPSLIGAVSAGGLLLYETFAVGNERYGRPRSADHLLRAGELLEAVAGQLQVVAYEAGLEDRPSGPRVVERICAARADHPITLPPPQAG